MLGDESEHLPLKCKDLRAHEIYASIIVNIKRILKEALAVTSDHQNKTKNARIPLLLLYNLNEFVQ